MDTLQGIKFHAGAGFGASLSLLGTGCSAAECRVKLACAMHPSGMEAPFTRKCFMPCRCSSQRAFIRSFGQEGEGHIL